MTSTSTEDEEEVTSAVTLFWSMLYNHSSKVISVPMDLEEETRKRLAGFLEVGNRRDDRKLATLRLSLAGGSSFGPAEVKAVISHLRCCPALTVFSLKKSADNYVMKALGKYCPLLQVGSISVPGYKYCINNECTKACRRYARHDEEALFTCSASPSQCLLAVVLLAGGVIKSKQGEKNLNDPVAMCRLNVIVIQSDLSDTRGQEAMTVASSVI